jgi:hypothetical protein
MCGTIFKSDNFRRNGKETRSSVPFFYLGDLRVFVQASIM